MSTIDVMELMAEWPAMTRTEHGALVHTHCLMPSGSTVNVFVQPAIDGFVASDSGAALGEISCSGALDNDQAKRHIARVAGQRGLSFMGGSILSPRVSASEVPLAVILVANVAKDAAEYLIETSRRDGEGINVHEAVRALVRLRFGQFLIGHEIELRGQSDRKYRFDNVLKLPSADRLIVDSVAHHANSINSRTVTHLDIRQKGYSGLHQRIVFDDRQKWEPEDLSLLEVGAIPVALSEAERVLGRMVA